MKWFDFIDDETPYKAIGTVVKMSNGEQTTYMESRRFATKEDAWHFFNNSPGRCILSHHDFTRKTTKILAYKFN